MLIDFKLLTRKNKKEHIKLDRLSLIKPTH